MLLRQSPKLGKMIKVIGYLCKVFDESPQEPEEFYEPLDINYATIAFEEVQFSYPIYKPQKEVELEEEEDQEELD